MTDDSLVATRSRRSNAGSRLKHLIEQEERASELQESASSIINDEDENVNLLFQEDEDDQEFLGSGEEEEDGEEEEEEEEGGGGGGGGDGEEGEEASDEEEKADGDENEDEMIDNVNRKRSHESDEEVEQVNSDEILSDSDISMSDSDESEGEKQLQKQERLKKRTMKRKQNAIPTIKQPKINDKPKIKKPKSSLISSDSLLLSMRRSSSRATAVENKQALVQKLKENEKKRASVAPIVRVKQIELTQDEKLAEAIDTEKANILSLQQFREQEIVKKERQKHLLQSRKKKLKNVIRLVSSERFITALDEVNEARHVNELNKSRSRKKLGRKKKVTVDPEIKRLPGEVDTELPIVKEELEQKRIQEEQLKENEVDSGNLQNDDEIKNKDIVKDITQEESVPQEISKSDSDGNFIENDPATKQGVEQTDTHDESIPPDNNIQEVEVQDSGDKEQGTATDIFAQSSCKKLDNNEIKSENLHDLMESSDTNQEPVQVSNDNDLKEKQIDLGAVEGESENIIESEKKEIAMDTDEAIKPSEKREEKRVTFVDDIQDDEKDESDQFESKHSSPDTDVSNTSEIFEGPSQRVSRNMVYLVDFEEKDEDSRLTDTNIKSFLFGAQSLLPASRRFKDLKTIMRIGEIENPYASVKPEKDELFEPVSELTEDNTMFEDLKRLPKLGITQAIVEEIEEDTQEENAAIVLKTEAPTGIYLPNGNKKICLISGTEVKYFDPSNGIPYSSVETYRFLKTIEQGNVPWYSMGEDANDNGPVEIYLGSRDSPQRNAKGVPEGFDR